MYAFGVLTYWNSFKVLRQKSLNSQLTYYTVKLRKCKPEEKYV